MVRSILVDGDKLASLVENSALGQEGFAKSLGMSRSGIFRLTRSGSHRMFNDRFRRVAELLRLTPDQLRGIIGAADQPAEKLKTLRIPAETYGQLSALATANNFPTVTDLLVFWARDATTSLTVGRTPMELPGFPRKASDVPQQDPPPERQGREGSIPQESGK